MGMVVLMEPKRDDQYSDEEAKRRFEAALRGAREVGHEAMKDTPPKRPKSHSAMKVGKPRAKAQPKERPASKGRVHKGRTRG